MSRSDPPLVSILIPCYNAERWVGEAIQSALDQTYPNTEIIVVDDGSTDNTPYVVKSFGASVVRSVRQDNLGAPAARNYGSSLARGEFLAFLDADDLWLRTRLERQIQANAESAERPVLWFTDAVVETRDGGKEPSDWAAFTTFVPRVPEKQAAMLDDPRGHLAYGDFINMSTVLVLKRAFMGAGMFDPLRKRGADLDFFTRLARLGAFGYVNERLAVRRMVGPPRPVDSLSVLRDGADVFMRLAFSTTLDGRARTAARRNWFRAAIRAHGLLLRGGSRSLARRELTILPGWWSRPKLLGRILASFFRPIPKR